ncbi:MAG: flagellar assembly protein FliX [Alphaproteobacteria bacterium]
MVVIRGVTGGTNVPGTRTTRGASGGFRVGGGADEAREANASTGVSAASAIGLLQVQELAPAGERDARAFRRGEDMLRELKELQLELLEGRADPARLQQLARLTEGDKPADPGLAEAVEAIALRARLELARRGIES